MGLLKCSLGMGNSKELLAFDRETGMGKWVKDHGETFGLYFLWIKPTLIVSDPEIVKGKGQTHVIVQ